MHSIDLHRSGMCSEILSPRSLKDDVPASKDFPGKKSYLTTKAVERYVAELGLHWLVGMNQLSIDEVHTWCRLETLASFS